MRHATDRAARAAARAHAVHALPFMRCRSCAAVHGSQERDPRAYQLLVSDGAGSCFVGCTPERLYARTGRHVASEAVAGTRPRGPPGACPRARAPACVRG